MKRIVILIDGTWNKEGITGNTNVAALDPVNRIATHAFIKTTAADGAAQHVHYHSGVGAEGDFFKRLLGGAIGLGLKQIIRECYDFVVADYAVGDEIYLIGFSRGAYAARALAGLIGASGIQRTADSAMFETAWQHYRVKPAVRAHPETASSSERTAIASYTAARSDFHDTRTVKCVAVWDTVGSYGIPAGLGLAPLARYFALFVLGFHDTSFGDHVEFGLHAVAVDEHRRSFVTTFWTIPRGKKPKGHVEQTWFAGSHCNVGGGYPDAGLSDQALVWMIARLQVLTGLEFDIDAVGRHAPEHQRRRCGFHQRLAKRPRLPTLPQDPLAGRHSPRLREQHCEPEGGAHQRAGPLECDRETPGTEDTTLRSAEPAPAYSGREGR
jgi:uncharacterized protein (DUF2235 family)